MSREWQQTKMHNYVMPNAVYYQTLWVVRDLDRMESRLNELSSDNDEVSTGIVKEKSSKYKHKRSKVEDSAMEKAILDERVTGIRNALQLVPEKYRSCIMDNIVLQEPVYNQPDKSWRAWKQKFLYNVAVNLSMM